jgi:hypothetical protein
MPKARQKIRPNEAIVRAINATDWQPLTGMVSGSVASAATSLPCRSPRRTRHHAAPTASGRAVHHACDRPRGAANWSAGRPPRKFVPVTAGASASMRKWLYALLFSRPLSCRAAGPSRSAPTATRRPTRTAGRRGMAYRRPTSCEFWWPAKSRTPRQCRPQEFG